MAITETDLRRVEIPTAINAIAEYAAVAVLTLFAACLRFYKLSQWSFWIDELFTIRDAFGSQALSIEDVYRIGNLTGFEPRFSSVSMSLIRLSLASLGVSEASARLVPALIGILTIPIGYFLFRKVLGVKTALIGALILAISPWHVYLSQNARYFSALVFFSILAFFFFFLSLEKNSPGFLILSIVFIALSALERMHALLLLPAVGLYIILLIILRFEKPAGFHPRLISLFMISPVVFYILLEGLNVFILNRRAIISVLFSPKFLGLVTYQPRWLLSGIITDVGIPLSVLAFLGGLSLLIKRSRIGLYLVCGALVPLGLVMILAQFFQTFNHYLLVAMVSWLILGGVGLSFLFERSRQVNGAFTVLGVLSAICLISYKDRVVKDFLYFFIPEGQSTILWVIAGIGVLLLLLALAGLFASYNKTSIWRSRIRLLDRFETLNNQVISRLGVALIALIVFTHPLLTEFMYYTYQHGYRDNDWRAAMEVIKRQRQSRGDAQESLVVSAMPPVASYYLGEKTMRITEIDLDQALREGKAIWLVEEYGLYKEMGDSFENWIAAHCKLVDEFDRYMRGVYWITRVDFCSTQG